MSARIRTAGLILVVAGAVMTGAPTARAFDSACETQDVNGDGEVDSKDWSGIVYKQVIYEGPRTVSPSDLRANSDGLLRLKGWLYYKTGSVKNAPVIVYNHGHDEERSEPCAIARFFVNRGFVVFAPLRRGHHARTPSPEPPHWNQIFSTGVHTDDYVQECLATACLDQVRCNFVPFCDEQQLEVDYMRRQVIDVRDQLAFIKAYPAVGGSGKIADPRRIAVVGHSFGGSLVLMANTSTSGAEGQAVTVSVSGAELSWDQNPFWETYLRDAVADAQRPIYFLQPKNGRSLGPTRILSRVAIDHEYRFEAAVFAPAPWDPADEDPEYLQAHGNFITVLDQVRSWGPSVIDFLERNELPPPE